MQLRGVQLVNFLQQANKPWYQIKNSTTGPTEVMIYDEIGFLGVTAQDFVKDLQDIQGPIDLHINSKGGDVFDGIAIYEALKNRTDPVNVFIDSLAASAASFIAMAGDHISIGRNAQMMIHDAQGMAIGNAKDMKDIAELLDKASNNIADIYMQRAGGTVEQWRTAMRDEKWYSAQEAVATGLADEITPIKNKTTNWIANAPIEDLTEEDITLDPEAIVAAFRKVM